MKFTLGKFAPRAALTLWLPVATSLGIVAIAYDVMVNLQEIEHALPITLSEQERDVTQLVHEVSELVGTVRLARVDPTPGRIEDVLAKVREVDECLEKIRGTYNFDNLVGASAAEAGEPEDRRRLHRRSNSRHLRHRPPCPIHQPRWRRHRRPRIRRPGRPRPTRWRSSRRQPMVDPALVHSPTRSKASRCRVSWRR